MLLCSHGIVQQDTNPKISTKTTGHNDAKVTIPNPDELSADATVCFLSAVYTATPEPNANTIATTGQIELMCIRFWLLVSVFVRFWPFLVVFVRNQSVGCPLPSGVIVGCPFLFSCPLDDRLLFLEVRCFVSVSVAIIIMIRTVTGPVVTAPQSQANATKAYSSGTAQYVIQDNTKHGITDAYMYLSSKLS